MYPLYWISEYWYCPRGCLLYIMGESYFANDNKDYIEGKAEHRKIDTEGIRRKKGVAQIKQFKIYSERLQISGKLDLLEIKDGEYYPVELKKGAYREAPQLEAQVKLQMLVLEDYLQVPVNRGYVSFSQPHQRKEISITEKEKKQLANKVVKIVSNLNEPEPFRFFPKANDSRCKKCSFGKHCEI